MPNIIAYSSRIGIDTILSKACNTCGELKPETLFKKNYKGKKRGGGWAGYSNRCLDCNTKQNQTWIVANRDRYNQGAKERRWRRKQRAIEYKGGECQHCFAVVHPASFDFHHLDPVEKDLDPGLMMSCSDTKLFIELDKCILLCANCHRVEHFKHED